MLKKPWERQTILSQTIDKKMSQCTKNWKKVSCTENSPGNCQTFRNKTAFSIQKHQQTKYSKPFHCVGHKALFKSYNYSTYVHTCHRFNFKASKSSKALKGALVFFFITFRKKKEVDSILNNFPWRNSVSLQTLELEGFKKQNKHFGLKGQIDPLSLALPH